MQKRTTIREQIVAAADPLLYRQGFEYTPFADTAGAVNLSRGGFHQHVRGKDDVLGTVPERRLPDTRATPFVAGDVIGAELAELAPGISDVRLAFLPGGAAP